MRYLHILHTIRMYAYARIRQMHVHTQLQRYTHIIHTYILIHTYRAYCKLCRQAIAHVAA